VVFTWRAKIFIFALSSDSKQVILAGTASLILSFYSHHIGALTKMKKPNLIESNEAELTQNSSRNLVRPSVVRGNKETSLILARRFRKPKKNAQSAKITRDP
jgi:hypothetical protein